MTVTETTAPEVPDMVRTERLLPYPPRRVWRALTDKAAIEKWLLPIVPAREGKREMPLDTPGESVTLRVSPAVRVAYEVIYAEPCRHLSLWWRVKSRDAENSEETVTTRVTWTLTPEQDGRATRLIIEQSPLGITALATGGSVPLKGVLARIALYLELKSANRRPTLRRVTVKEKLKCQ